jgi:hypothetical protein
MSDNLPIPRGGGFPDRYERKLSRAASREMALVQAQQSLTVSKIDAIEAVGHAALGSVAALSTLELACAQGDPVTAARLKHTADAATLAIAKRFTASSGTSGDGLTPHQRVAATPRSQPGTPDSSVRAVVRGAWAFGGYQRHHCCAAGSRGADGPDREGRRHRWRGAGGGVTPSRQQLLRQVEAYGDEMLRLRAEVESLRAANAELAIERDVTDQLLGEAMDLLSRDRNRP